MKQTILITTFLISLFSCKKTYVPFEIPCTTTRDLNICKSNIVGTWDFIQEARPNPREGKTDYITNKTQGYVFKLEFNNDKVTFYKNDIKDSVYTYKVLPQGEITGYNSPDDYWTVLVLYNLHNGLRRTYVPIKTCDNYMLNQFQYVSSVEGETIWKRQ
jgi:hypothetical protein